MNVIKISGASPGDFYYNTALQNGLLKDINELLDIMQRDVHLNKLGKIVSNTQTKIKNQVSVDNLWELFFNYFEEVHSSFINTLKSKYDLSSNDLRLCAFLRINLSNKEICQITNVSLKSIHTIIYRVKKKIGLPRELNLSDFLVSEKFKNIDAKTIYLVSNRKKV